MKWSKYVKDHAISIALSLGTLFLILLLLMAFKVPSSLIFCIFLLLVVNYVSILFISYFRKRNFFRSLLFQIEQLDQSYLVLEIIEKPTFYEGELFYQALYEINKSMCENIKKEKLQLKDFKEYIEMWIHEVKIPLSSLMLTFNNHTDVVGNKVKGQLSRLENSLEQVLYYVRSENAEKDYLISEVELSKIIKKVGLRYMNELLDEKIDYIVENVNQKVLSDAKWLEFILGQIVNNSIKYRKKIPHSYIKFFLSLERKNRVTLTIEDNGLGISSSDIKQVFDKTFTGKNGREKSTSTGMGLYICKNLCQKLGHKIEVCSVEGEYTRVMITFSKNPFYDVVRNSDEEQ